MKRLRPLALAALLAAPLGAPAASQDHAAVLAQQNGIRVLDGYAVAAGPAAPTAAAYMVIENDNAAPDRLIAAEGAAARRVELHAHVLDDGIARMRALEDGVDLPAGGAVALERGGLHVMLMGLAEPLEPGKAVALTLVFERAGRIDVTLPVEAVGAPDQ